MFKILSIVAVAIGLGSIATAHEMTPTYPKLEPSFLTGIYSTTLYIFNKREDITFYQIGVFTENWKSIPFATYSTIIEVDYLENKSFTIYIREIDFKNNLYVCTLSKIPANQNISTGISSKICSKIRKE